MPQWVTGDTKDLELTSPCDIVTIRKLVFDVHFKFQWDKYMESNEETDVNNTNMSQIYPVIYLVSRGNIQGTLKEFYLETGFVKNNRSSTVFTMPYRFIERFHTWGKKYIKEKRK